MEYFEVKTEITLNDKYCVYADSVDDAAKSVYSQVVRKYSDAANHCITQIVDKHGLEVALKDLFSADLRDATTGELINYREDNLDESIKLELANFFQLLTKFKNCLKKHSELGILIEGKFSIQYLHDAFSALEESMSRVQKLLNSSDEKNLNFLTQDQISELKNVCMRIDCLRYSSSLSIYTDCEPVFKILDRKESFFNADKV